jgi:hypothetical protein
MRLIALLLMAALAACAAPGDRPPVSAPAAKARPNIVVIMFDDLSPRLGAFGDSVAHTPRWTGSPRKRCATARPL